MKTPSLDDFERRIVKRLVADGERNQDVHQLINLGRVPTVNFGRISGSATWQLEPADDDQLARYKYEKSLFDLKTGLSPIQDERLFRAREAMLSAVQIFNTPNVMFKVELFSVISQIAWTYLLHEFYLRKGVQIEDQNGNTFLLGQMIMREDCPLAEDVKKNLKAVKILRDEVEHKLLKSLGRNFWTLFQSNCLNFDKTIKELFGESLGVSDTLSISLQFSKMEAI